MSGGLKDNSWTEKEWQEAQANTFPTIGPLLCFSFSVLWHMAQLTINLLIEYKFLYAGPMCHNLSSFLFSLSRPMVKDVLSRERKRKEERLREQLPVSFLFLFLLSRLYKFLYILYFCDWAWTEKEIRDRKLALRAPAVTRATSSSSLTGMRFQEHWSQSVDDVQGRWRFSLPLSLWPPAQTSVNLCGGKGKRAEKGVCTRTLSFSFPWPGLDGNPPLRGTNWWSRSKERKKKESGNRKAAPQMTVWSQINLCAWRLPVLISPLRLRRAVYRRVGVQGVYNFIYISLIRR